jgi:sulfite exporter TauE/SafE
MAVELGTTALLMGLAGGPHCALMCGAACAGIGRGGAPGGQRALALFHLGRAAGYAAMGALAAWSLQGLGWLGGASVALRPAWSFMHLAAVALGVVLLVQGRQPAWLERHGKLLWQRTRARLPRRAGTLWLGMAWALMPCGLLQAALMTAALTGHPAAGASAMLGFAAGSAVSLWAAPWLVQQWPAWAGARWGAAPGSVVLRASASAGFGTRAAGLALAASSAWALWRGLVHNEAPWCLPG